MNNKWADVVIELGRDSQFQKRCHQLILRGGKMPKLPVLDKVKFSAAGAFLGQALGFAAMFGYEFGGAVNNVLDFAVAAGGLVAGAFGAFVAGYAKTETAAEVSPK